MSDTVLVTGGSGFIGSWVLRALLQRGVQVVSLDLYPAPERWSRVLGDLAGEVHCVQTALTDRDALRAMIEDRHVTHIVHLAALLTPACQQDPFLGCRVNVLGGTALFDAARQAGHVRAIAYASSYAVYGSDPASEAAQRPPMFYGAFKRAFDLIAEQYAVHFGLPSVAVRPHVVYGPERDLGLTAGPSLACQAAARGEPYTIGYTGSAGYDYVEDVATAFVRAVLECPPGATVLDLPSENATPEDFVRLIEGIMPQMTGRIQVRGPAIPTNIPPQPRDLRTVYPDWTPTPLSEGVRKTIAFYRGGS